MDRLIESLSWAQLSWAVIVVYVLHYAEEGPRLVKWMNSKYNSKRDKWKKAGIVYNQAKLNAENIVLFLLTLIQVILININPDNNFVAVVLYSASIGFIINTVFHALPTIKTGVYSPGVVTACLLNPFLLYAFTYKAIQTGLFQRFELIATALIMGGTLLFIVAIFTHKVIMRKWIY